MKKVITYGTYDILHYGHIRLLKRAKSLGDYLIVGVTADDYDKTRGKINVKQSLMERIEAVRSTGLADEIIVEEYEGQKIDDIKRYGIDIFAIGSDWEGKFDYLKEYCDVIYLERTKGISSSDIRDKNRAISLGIVGNPPFLNKFISESKLVNGLKIEAICTSNIEDTLAGFTDIPIITSDYNKLLEAVDAVYIYSHPTLHYQQIKKALRANKHVLCESPITLDITECNELFELARSKELILTEAIKTAYSTAYYRLLLLAKGGKIGKIVSVDATCTSLRDIPNNTTEWSSIYSWGPTGLLPVYQLLGTDYSEKILTSHFVDKNSSYDVFTKIDFIFPNAVASVKVGKGIKSEGELIISGTKGYFYVPAPWWKTDYFEIRYENPLDNKRYFYQLDGEGIIYELVTFVQSIEQHKASIYIEKEVTEAIVEIMQDFKNRINLKTI